MRQRLPRSALGDWAPARDRGDPVDLLAEEDRSRIARLLPIRYARMCSSPFAFYRGALAVMARDLATAPVTGIRVQMVGDAHAANFGYFGTPERDRVFDVNDFDETLEGPWEWDVRRLAVSLALVAGEHRYGRTASGAAARTAARAYREHLLAFARMPYLDAWYAHLDRASARAAVGARARRLLSVGVRRARGRTGFQAFPELARRRD